MLQTKFSFYRLTRQWSVKNTLRFKRSPILFKNPRCHFSTDNKNPFNLPEDWMKLVKDVDPNRLVWEASDVSFRKKGKKDF